MAEIHPNANRQTKLQVFTTACMVALLLIPLTMGAVGTSAAWAATTTDTTAGDTTTPALTTTVNHTVTVTEPPTTVTETTPSIVSATVTPTTTTVEESESGSNVPGWGWALIGAAAIVLVGGVFALGRSSSHHRESHTDQPPPGRGQV